MARRRAFPPRLPRLLRWAEKQGSLPEVLHMAGEMFAARASAQATFAATALSVACFVLILLGVILDRRRADAPHVILISSCPDDRDRRRPAVVPEIRTRRFP